MRGFGTLAGVVALLVVALLVVGFAAAPAMASEYFGGEVGAVGFSAAVLPAGSYCEPVDSFEFQAFDAGDFGYTTHPVSFGFFRGFRARRDARARAIFEAELRRQRALRAVRHRGAQGFRSNLPVFVRVNGVLVRVR